MKRQRPITRGHVIEATDEQAEAAAALGIRYHDGYQDPFTREQSPLALYGNGERVRKGPSVNPDDDDLTDLGTLGTVLGSIGAPDIGVAYFVEWDTRPKRAVMIHERKLCRA